MPVFTGDNLRPEKICSFQDITVFSKRSFFANYFRNFENPDAVKLMFERL